MDMAAEDDLPDLQSVRARVLAEATALLTWASARDSQHANHAEDAAKGLADWCKDDIWLAEKTAEDAMRKELAR